MIDFNKLLKLNTKILPFQIVAVQKPLQGFEVKNVTVIKLTKVC